MTMTWIFVGLQLLILGVIGWLSRAITVYSKEKGKNLATKEDIAEITQKIEAVRAEFAAIRDARQRRHELSIAALDKRLEAHQKAFSLWRQLLINANHLDTKLLNDCEEWRAENCLYLSPEAAFAFKNAIAAAYLHSDMKRAGRPEDRDNWKELSSAGEVIAKAVQLPGLGEEEVKSTLTKGGTQRNGKV
jgi:hypothetical protein